jgi:phosphoglycerate-specific signal transduction histidine kinase
MQDRSKCVRITHERVRVQKERISLAEVLQRAVDGVQARMDERGHTLTLELPAQELSLEADPARIEQVITNLLANAAKYAERIRREEHLRPLVLVALTGYGGAEDKSRAMASGFDHHLVQPVELSALSDLVDRLTPAHSKEAPPGASH